MHLYQFRMCSLYIVVTVFDIYSCLEQGHQSFPYREKARIYAAIQLEDKMSWNSKKKKRRRYGSLYRVMYVYKLGSVPVCCYEITNNLY